MAQTLAADQTGITVAASRIVAGEPATFDLVGLRLGMSEPEVERAIRDRGMKVSRRSRMTTFEDSVRGLINVRGGRLPMRGGNVLDAAEIDDGKGGRIMIRMLAWPAGAHLRSITYLPPAGTGIAAWRGLLEARYGPHSTDSGAVSGEGLHAVWCGQASCYGGIDGFVLAADVNEQGGSIALAQPEGTAQKLKALVEQAANDRTRRSTPSF